MTRRSVKSKSGNQNQDYTTSRDLQEPLQKLQTIQNNRNNSIFQVFPDSTEETSQLNSLSTNPPSLNLSNGVGKIHSSIPFWLTTILGFFLLLAFVVHWIQVLRLVIDRKKKKPEHRIVGGKMSIKTLERENSVFLDFIKSDHHDEYQSFLP
ncbi:uncharacterized protein LOC111705465 [Eurytemora carolleeae]|uniref:uncharacterized protein LOC111705465 n=1 Tax=Eurytemora carolleeae TaxID=1294199 RepID=UPI000C75A568|nr:uncharacterized protein LOC111705465 [Eurytemora carolleeae]|eukprot:XP_023333791.1 uncharacterized protein LOC111705465 [Eurytemora affinis]